MLIIAITSKHYTKLYQILPKYLNIVENTKNEVSYSPASISDFWFPKQVVQSAISHDNKVINKQNQNRYVPQHCTVEGENNFWRCILSWTWKSEGAMDGESGESMAKIKVTGVKSGLGLKII